MPKLRKPTKADFSAMSSDDVAIRRYRNQMIISTIKRPRKSTSAKKEDAIDRFAAASEWAKMTLMEPGMKELYSKRIDSKLTNAHTVAVADFLNAPTIHYVSFKQHTGAISDKIRIKATDDFKVVAVEVMITDKNGNELENGSATRYPRKPAMWIYALTVANPELHGTVIKVTALDRPGNTAIWEERI